MEANLSDYFDELPKLDQRKVVPEARQSKRASRIGTYRPETDIVLWLAGNVPVNFQELADLRYCLYHRCSRAGFMVKRRDKDDFTLTGRHSSLQIVNNKARRYLLWKLRLLAQERGWRGALPRNGSPLTRPCDFPAACLSLAAPQSTFYDIRYNPPK
jgi:hypothetical protein